MLVSEIHTSKHQLSKAGVRNFISDSSGLCSEHMINKEPQLCHFVHTFIHISVCDCPLTNWQALTQSGATSVMQVLCVRRAELQDVVL